MVFHITRALILSIGRPCKFAEDRLVWFADNVTQDIQSPTVRHANDNILYTVVDAAVNQSLHAGNQGFTSFQSKTLVVGIFRSEKSLKARAPYETIQNSPLVVRGVLVGDRDLDSVSKPVALFSIGNV